MKFTSAFVFLLVCAAVCLVIVEGRPQPSRKEFVKVNEENSDDLEAGAEEDLKGAASSYGYGYGYYPGYYPSYYRRYNYPYYTGYGYSPYARLPYYSSNYYQGLGGLYSGLFF